jgi:hypothetical protein
MHKNDDGLFAAFGLGFALIWIFSAVVSLGFIGVVIWAIIELVQHFTK